MRRAIAVATTLTLGTIAAGCAWIVGVSGDVQLEPAGDAAADHDDANGSDARDAATPADAYEESADASPRDEDGAVGDSTMPDARDGAPERDARG